MPDRAGWTRDQLIIALKLYCEIPFGKMHSRNPEVIRYAKLIGRTPSALAMKLTNMASLDPAIKSTGRKGLRGASQADRQIWDEMTSDWTRFANEIERTEREIGDSSLLDSPQEGPSELLMSYEGRTKSALIEARIGQGLFRNAVLSSYENRCCISGLALPGLLVASHIVPWQADAKNRLNPRNGLCLSSIHDRAFDLGLITISPDLRLLLSRRIQDAVGNAQVRHTFHDYAGRRITIPAKFPPNPDFLKYHRVKVFIDEV